MNGFHLIFSISELPACCQCAGSSLHPGCFLVPRHRPPTSSNTLSSNSHLHSSLFFFQPCRLLPSHKITMSAAACIFCKIIKGTQPQSRYQCNRALRKLTIAPGEIPSMKIFESDKTFAFLDIGPLSRGHSVRLFLPLNLPFASLISMCLCV